jgi:hypothetical protein
VIYDRSLSQVYDSSHCGDLCDVSHLELCATSVCLAMCIALHVRRCKRNRQSANGLCKFDKDDSQCRVCMYDSKIDNCGSEFHD